MNIITGELSQEIKDFFALVDAEMVRLLGRDAISVWLICKDNHVKVASSVDGDMTRKFIAAVSKEMTP